MAILLACLPKSSQASTIILVNPSDQGSISTTERSNWLASLSPVSALDFGLVTDPGTTHAADLMTLAVTTTINANSYAFSITEGGFGGSLSFPSTITGGTNPGGGLSGFGTVNYDFERPATQNGISSASWGFDTGSTVPNIVPSTRDTLRFDFTASSTPVRSFSVSLLDFESSVGGRGYITAYDVAGQLLGMHTLDFGLLDGASEGHQVAISTANGTNSLGYLFFVVGDNTSSFAMGDFALGSTWLAPEPNRAVLLMISMVGVILRRRH